MLLLIGKTVHRWWRELSVAPSGRKTKQSEVIGGTINIVVVIIIIIIIMRKRTATKMSGILALNHGGTGT